MDNRQHLTWDNPKQSVIEAVMNEGTEEQEKKREGGKGKGNKWGKERKSKTNYNTSKFFKGSDINSLTKIFMASSIAVSP